MTTLINGVTIRGTVVAATAWYNDQNRIEAVGLVIKAHLSDQWIPELELFIATIKSDTHLRSLMYASDPLQVRVTGDMEISAGPDGVLYELVNVEHLVIL